MIVTIDGPAGAGKSSAARALARRLGFEFLDTGAMYRAVTYWALSQRWPLEDAERLAQMARQLHVDWRDERVLVNGQDVTPWIRLPEVSDSIHWIADHPEIRDHLVQIQRRWAQGRNVVTEGRDQGTIVFPDAECKVFLTASLDERVRRRMRQYQSQGVTMSPDEVLEELTRRDQRDASRPVGNLRQADDAVVVVTDGMSLEQVVDHLEWLVQSRSLRKRHASCAMNRTGDAPSNTDEAPGDAACNG